MNLRFQMIVTTLGYRNCTIQRKYLVNDDTVQGIMEVLEKNREDFGSFEGSHKFTNVNIFSTNLMKLEYSEQNGPDFKVFEVELKPVLVIEGRIFEMKETFIDNFN